jgi:hypothetical protein
MSEEKSEKAQKYGMSGKHTGSRTENGMTYL